MSTSPARGYVPMLVRDVPANIRTAASKDARARGVGLAEIVGEILGAAFGIEYQTTGRSIPPKLTGGGTRNMSIRVPPELRTRIRVAAAEIPRGTVRGVVIQTLAEHYHGRDQAVKKIPSAERRPRQKTNRLAA